MTNQWTKAVLPTLGIALVFGFPVASLFEAETGPISIAFALLLGVYALLSAIQMRGDQPRYLALVTVFVVATFVLAYLLAPSWSLTEKLNQFGFVLALFGIATAYALNSPAAVRYFGLSLMVLGGLGAGLLLLNPQEFQAGRLSFGENNPIWMARIVGWLGLGAFAMFLAHPRRWFVCGILFLVSVAGIVITASRGPLVGLAAACLVGALVANLRHKWALAVGVAFAGVFAFLALSQLGLIDSNILTLGSREDSVNIRSSLIDYTLYTIAYNPGGIGVGWFNYQDALFYPHNIWLEVFVEWGWPFGIAFTLITLVGIWGVLTLEDRFTFIKMLLIYEVVNASLSGDITSPRFLYGLLIIGLGNVAWKLGSRKRNAQQNMSFEQLHTNR